ncbi:hypothetical protein P692DRAFT_201780428, partial [Suillus brevipes Sb2]
MSLPCTVDAGLDSYSGSVQLSTREENCGSSSCFSLTFSVVLSSSSNCHALRRCVVLPPSAPVFFVDGL